MTPEEIALLCEKIAIAAAIAFLFFDVIMSIVKKRNLKLSITALVFLSLAAILFIVAQFILEAGLVSTILTVLAIVLLAAYLVCDVIIVVGNIKRKYKQIDELSGSSQEGQASSEEPTSETEEAEPETSDKTGENK